MPIFVTKTGIMASEEEEEEKRKESIRIKAQQVVEQTRLLVNTSDMVISDYHKDSPKIHGLGTHMRFGKYLNSNLSIKDICDQDPDYLIWLINNIPPFKVTREVVIYLQAIYPNRNFNIPENKIW